MNKKKFFFKIIFLILLSLSTKKINCMQNSIYINCNELCNIIIVEIEDNYSHLIINKNIIWQQVLNFASKIRSDDSELTTASLTNFAEECFIPYNQKTTIFIYNIITNYIASAEVNGKSYPRKNTWIKGKDLEQKEAIKHDEDIKCKTIK